MKQLILGFSAAALLAAAAGAGAQETANDNAAPDTTTTTTTTKTDSAKTRIAAIDTSNEAFGKLDADNDGRISALEAANNPKVASAFTMADRDKDGYLSKDEFKALAKATGSTADSTRSESSNATRSESSTTTHSTTSNPPQ